MEELKYEDYKDLKGGAVLITAFYVVGVLLLATATAKVAFSSKAKIKLPFGFEISFEDAQSMDVNGIEEEVISNKTFARTGISNHQSNSSYGLITD
jgi:hypothetical protein